VSKLRRILPVLFGVIGVVLFPVIMLNFFFVFTVPSESMLPTLAVGERFITLINKTGALDYGVYCFYSRETQTYLVKRLVGLPGDDIDIINGELYRNGTLVNEDYVLYDSPYTGYFSVPSGYFFFLGDNRAMSRDARYWSNPYIPRADVIGEVVLRWSPYYRIGRIK